MTDQDKAWRLAHLWIEAWNRGEPESIPLAETFVHTSPFGRLEGRENYLEKTKPIAKRNVTSLTVLKTIATSEEAVILYEVQTPTGTLQACDWIFVEGENIAEIRSFYDPTDLPLRNY